LPLYTIIDSGRRAMPSVPHHYLSGDPSVPKFDLKRLRII
jgi:hypothetical protein